MTYSTHTTVARPSENSYHEDNYDDSDTETKLLQRCWNDIGTLLRRLVEILYDRNDQDFHRGTFRVRGDVIEVFPVNADFEWIG